MNGNTANYEPLLSTDSIALFYFQQIPEIGEVRSDFEVTAKQGDLSAQFAAD